MAMAEDLQKAQQGRLQERGDRLDTLINAQPHLRDYAGDLIQALWESGIGPVSFDILRSKKDVIAAGAALLGKLDMHPAFLENPLNVYLTLGIADAYIAVIRDRRLTEDDRKAAEESLSLALGMASYELTPEGYITHSGYMHTNFDSKGSKLRRIKPLVGPSHARKTAAEEIVKPVKIEEVSQRLDELATKRFAKSGEIAGKPVSAYIADVAKRLGVAVSEMPSISFRILASPESTLEVGASAWTLFYFDGRVSITLPNDWDEHEAEHEIIHALTRGLRYGFRSHIGKGITEAMTEMMTSKPSVYEPQRKVLATLFEKMGPVFEHHLKNAYIHGDQASLTIALTELVRHFGIQAVYQLFYLSSGTVQFQASDSGFIDRAFLPPESVTHFFHPPTQRRSMLLEAEVID